MATSLHGLLACVWLYTFCLDRASHCVLCLDKAARVKERRRDVRLQVRECTVFFKETRVSSLTSKFSALVGWWLQDVRWKCCLNQESLQKPCYLKVSCYGGIIACVDYVRLVLDFALCIELIVRHVVLAKQYECAHVVEARQERIHYEWNR